MELPCHVAGCLLAGNVRVVSNNLSVKRRRCSCAPTTLRRIWEKVLRVADHGVVACCFSIRSFFEKLLLIRHSAESVASPDLTCRGGRNSGSQYDRNAHQTSEQHYVWTDDATCAPSKIAAVVGDQV